MAEKKKMTTAKYELIELVLTEWFQQIQPLHLPVVLAKGFVAKTNDLMQNVYEIIF